MTRKAINAWYDPELDPDIAEWQATCANVSDYVRRAIKEKIRRWKYAETREQETLDEILVEVAKTRDIMARILERIEQ
jgi:hypothetical protein